METNMVLEIEKSGRDKPVEPPTIEVIELVCQNTPDFTHGTSSRPV